MPISPSEMQLMFDAERLIEAVERDAGIRLDGMQRQRAISAVEIELAERDRARERARAHRLIEWLGERREQLAHECDATNIAIAADGRVYCAHCGWNDPQGGGS